MGFFSKIANALKKTREALGGALNALFAKNKIGDEFYDELEEILISSDISVITADEIVEELRAEVKQEKLKDKEFIVNVLKDALEERLTEAEVPELSYPAVIMLVGVNGVGKTTTVGKLANYFLQKHKSVTVAAADTFRAAASDQLSVWAERAKVRIVKHEEGSDPSAVVYDALSSAKARLVSELPAQLKADVLAKMNLDKILAVNLKYNNELTTKVKTEDLNNISMTSGMVQSGQRIIDTGEIVTEEKYNILDSMRRESQMQEENTFNRQTTLIAGQILLVVCLFALLYVYLRMFRLAALRNWRYVVMLLSYMVIFLAASNVVARTGENFYFYAIPYTLLPIIVSIFGENKIDTRTGLFAHIITILIASFQVPMPYTFVLLQISVGMVAINSIKDFSQRSQFVRTAGIITVSYFIMYFGYILIVYNDFSMFEWNHLFALLANGILLMLAYPLIFLTEKLFKFTSNVTLLELTNTNNPVLRELSEKAPGTFQHSMQVSNLAAEVAETIGANPLLTRTGALYHDIGKLGNPAFFTENAKNDNLHANLTPEQNAQQIIKHVTDGVTLAKQHQLPDKIIAFIKTHHGKSVTKYFYNTWMNEHPGETPDLSAFSYPGPNPTTKEQGIVMICDGVEAASRSLPEYTEENIDNLVDKLVNGIIKEHYLDDAISYPELKNPPKEESDDNPAESDTEQTNRPETGTDSKTDSQETKNTDK